MRAKTNFPHPACFIKPTHTIFRVPATRPVSQANLLTPAPYRKGEGVDCAFVVGERGLVSSRLSPLMGARVSPRIPSPGGEGQGEG